MAPRDDRRRALLGFLADHVLREGLGGASLRPMAATAGTSDRMLLYYFADKDELLAATLGEVARRLEGLLDAGAPGQASFDDLLARLWATVRRPEMRPYAALWLELAAASARGQEPQRAVAGRIADRFLGWIEARLAGGSAFRLLATLEGMVLLDAVGRGEGPAGRASPSHGD